jgi:Fumarylacetoacetate (FAA) hydrolase family
MFRPRDHPLERGWVGRIEDDHVIHLAAQTLEAFFTGGGTAREHAVYPLDAIRLLAPVLHPPSIRIFDDESSFAFANPAAIVGPDAEIRARGDSVALLPRVAAMIGAEGRIGGFTGFADWREGPAPPPKDRDFAHGLGPLVVTPDEISQAPEIVVHVDGSDQRFGHGELATVRSQFDWEAARSLAAERTVLRPGDILAGPIPGGIDPLPAGTEVAIEFEVIGTLRQVVR